MLDVEGKVDAQNIRIETLKVHGKNEHRTASSTPSGNAMMENQVVQMQTELNQMKAKTALQTTDRCKTMVLGGFASLEALESATTWLEHKFESATCLNLREIQTIPGFTLPEGQQKGE